MTVVADSAQFSTAVSELAPPGTAGSALAIQTALGFILTGVTILLVGALAPTDGAGWQVAFALLALGPAVGIVAMGRLRRRARCRADGERPPLTVRDMIASVAVRRSSRLTLAVR